MITKSAKELGLEVWKGHRSEKLHFKTPGGRVLCRVRYKHKNWIQMNWAIVKFSLRPAFCTNCLIRYEILAGVKKKANGLMGLWYNEASIELGLQAPETSQSAAETHPDDVAQKSIDCEVEPEH